MKKRNFFFKVWHRDSALVVSGEAKKLSENGFFPLIHRDRLTLNGVKIQNKKLQIRCPRGGQPGCAQVKLGATFSQIIIIIILLTIIKTVYFQFVFQS